MTGKHDVFIVGGGPAGLAAAIAAARKGLRVVVADGNAPPIDKACGEGLMPDCRLAAAALGIHIPASLGREFRGIRFHASGRTLTGDFPHGKGLAVRRLALHRVLAETARNAGVELRWNTPVASLDSISAPWIVGADGTRSRVRAWAGLEASHANSHRFAFRRHFAVTPWSDYVEICWAQGCQAYVTPVSHDEVGVALISRQPELRLDQALGRFFPALRERLAGAVPASRERGAITATARLRSVARGNVALIGDASGSVDAITGEGLCLAFRQASLLAEAIARNDLSFYAARHAGLAARKHAMARLLLTLDRGAARRGAVMTALSAMPGIFRSLLAIHVRA